MISKRTENMKKSNIILNKLKNAPSRKSVRIMEERNTFDIGQTLPKDFEIKKEDILTTPIGSQRNFKTLIKLDVDLVEKAKVLMIDSIDNKSDADLMKKSQEKISPQFGFSKTRKNENYELKNVINMEKPNESILNKSDMNVSILNLSNNMINSNNNISYLNNSNLMNLNANALKSGKTTEKNKFSSGKQNKTGTSPNEKISKSQLSKENLVQFSSILDSNNDLHSVMNTAKFIRENKG